MQNSPTGGESSSTGLENQPTGQEQVQVTPAESQNQETISGEQSQGTVSTDTAKPNTNTNSENSGSQNDDDSLAKFAKSQGFDPENLSDDVKRALKIAHDNQKAYRNSNNGQQKLEDTTKSLGGTDVNARVAALEYQTQTDRFFADKDRNVEPIMTQILNEKVAELTPSLGEAEAKKYAYNLSRDLKTLYDMARLRNGAVDGQVDIEAIRREERESIRNKQNAGGGQPHASTNQAAKPEKIDRQWLESHYDPSNEEHRKLVDEAVRNGDL